MLYGDLIEGLAFPSGFSSNFLAAGRAQGSQSCLVHYAWNPSEKKRKFAANAAQECKEASKCEPVHLYSLSLALKMFENKGACNP